MKPSNLSLFCLAVTLLFFSIPSSNLFAQKTNDKPETYDFVYLGKDKGSIRGQIISFNEADGYLVIEDRTGRRFTLGREDYEYYKEDIPYKKKKKKRNKNSVSKQDSISVNPRKEQEIEFSVGISPYPILFIEGRFDGTDKKTTNNTLMTMSANVGVGKYFTRQHYVGVNFDYAILPNHYFGSGVEGTIRNYFAVGARYKLQYDAYKSNMAWYLNVNGKYNVLKGELNHAYKKPWDAVFTNQVLEETNNTFSIGLGPGLAFILKNKKSITLEVNATRHFEISNVVFNTDITPGDTLLPLSNRSITGITLSIMYNL